MSTTDKDLEPFLPGDRYRDYRACVISIAGADAPPVVSAGKDFLNIDNWTARRVVSHMCEWAKANPKATPKMGAVQGWCTKTNREPCPVRQIRVAETPAKLSIRTRLALVGGAYHEALHTLHTRRTPLDPKETYDVIAPRWGLVEQWGNHARLILELSNLVEDIRIERLGNANFPGIYVMMHDLQDFILDRELEGDQKRPDKPLSALSVIVRAFRDVGLGYNTDKAQAALGRYRNDQPEAYRLVTEGALTPILKESITLTAKDDMGSLRLAMEMLGVLQSIADSQPQGEDPDETGPGKPSKKGGGQGKGKSAGGKGQPDSGKPGEGTEAGGGPDGTSGQSNDGGKEDKDTTGGTEEEGGGGNIKPGAKTGEGPPSGEGGASGTGGEGKGGEGGGTDKGKGDGGGEPGKGGGRGLGLSGHEEPEDVDIENLKDHKSYGSGGNSTGSDNLKLRNLINHALLTGEKVDIQDVSQALQGSVDDAWGQEMAKLKAGEAPYRPYTTSLDEYRFVQTSDPARDREIMAQLTDMIRLEASAIRSRLQMKFRAAEMTNTAHGTRRGRDLSDRMLVDSVVEMRSGEEPRRAFWDRSLKQDNSIAAVVVVDQSFSMIGKLKETAQVVLALCDPLDQIGAALMVTGFRNGNTPQDLGDYQYDFHHRYAGIKHDIFKSWRCRLAVVRHRFAHIRADGGTPMADGVQFGLECLDQRRERHRFVFVVTDGQPDRNQAPVMRYLNRQAKETGIHVVGIGLGRGSEYVRHSFPDHVWAPRIKDLPPKMAEKVYQLVADRVTAGPGRR